MKQNKKTITILSAIIVLIAIYLVGNVLALSITSSSTSPNEVQPGEKVSVRITLKNNLESDDIENVKVSLILNGEYISTGVQIMPSVPFAPYQGSSQFITDIIESDDSKTVNFELIADADADSGIYRIPVKMEYTVNDVPKTDEGIIGIIINALPEFSVSTDSAGLIKGQSSDVTIKLINSGLGDAKFTQVKIGTIANANKTSSDNFYIGDINKDDFDSVKVSLNVNANAPSSINIPVTIIYKDSRNNDFQETKTLSLKTYTLKEAQAIGLAQKSKIGLYATILVVAIILYLIYRFFKRRKKNKLSNQ